MVRQWQEFFYDKRYAATPLTRPGLREARRGLRAGRASASSEASRMSPAAVEARARHDGTVRDRLPRRAGRSACIRWCPPAPTSHEMITARAAVVETGRITRVTRAQARSSVSVPRTETGAPRRRCRSLNSTRIKRHPWMTVLKTHVRRLCRGSPRRAQPRRVSSFRRRGYNIESLSGRAHAASPGVSRMTLVVEADEDVARRHGGEPLQADRRA